MAVPVGWTRLRHIGGHGSVTVVNGFVWLFLRIAEP
jgi:hypothetical protein